MEQTAAMKKELTKMLKKRQKQENLLLKLKQNRASQIKDNEQSLKQLYMSVHYVKLNEVRMMKAIQIKEEISKISKKDLEARRLEKKED